MENKMSILEKISKFDSLEQIVLLLSRAEFNEWMSKYINELIMKENVDWDRFLGLVINHRVNGVICKRCKDIRGVPYVLRRALDYMLLSQRVRNHYHKNEIHKLFLVMEEKEINYAFLKGAVLNAIYYEDGERISNDTDILVDVKDLDKIIRLCTSIGYVQGHIENDRLIKATKKDILFSRLNTYETVPFIKKIDNDYVNFHIFDINFRLGNDDMEKMSPFMLQGTKIVSKENIVLRTMPVEKFLIYLCIHLFREAVMVYKIVQGTDLVLYKFMDIHHYILLNKNNISWNKMQEETITLDRIRDVYYTLFFTEKLYPGTVDDKILDMFEPEDVHYLDQYRGRDNSDEVYDWKMDFYERMFHPRARIAEAEKNIGRESERYNNIREELQRVED
ncbi:MAG: nucleotidyltransferase family protein [Eubacterium sp.]|nr:nucleotidyltransferase family protein [Eubacterium sp.]